MSQRLRRSARARKPVTYNVGDIIEYKRRSRTGHGRLVYRLTEGDSPNPLWLVSFDDGSNDDEIYEKHFTKLVSRDKPTKVDKRRRPQRRGGREASSMRDAAITGIKNDAGKGVTDEKEKDSSSSSSSSSSSCSSDTERRNSVDALVGTTKSRNDCGPEKAVHESSSLLDKAGQLSARASASAAAREQRRRRRQAIIEEEKVLAVEKSVSKKRGAASTACTNNNNKKVKAGQAEEEVVKVNLNTGTLYLYRGLNRRAVFVRRS